MASVPGRESQRRLMLRVLNKLMIGVCVLVAAWVILSPLFKNPVPVNDKIVETRIDVSEFEGGTVDIIEWMNKPLIIARRTTAIEKALNDADHRKLSDANSERSVQPESFRNRLRSPVEGWFVAIGIGTSSGCALRYSSTNSGGEFIDACDGSRYDLAGRAFASGRAKKNLPVPYWSYDEGAIYVSTRRVSSSAQ